MKKFMAVILVLSLCMGIVGSAMAQTVTFGSIGYRPISWIVLSSDRQYTVLLSEYALLCESFDDNSSSWATSDLRAWLNNQFAYRCFSNAERKNMYAMNGDYVWLPSVGDMTSPAYGFSSNWDAADYGRAAIGSRIAIDSGLWVTTGNYCSYYTMTPQDGQALYQIRSDGSVGIARCDRDNVGVRPMIVVRTAALY